MKRSQWISLLAIAGVIALYGLGDGERLLDPRLYQARFVEQPLSTALIFLASFTAMSAMFLPVTGVFIVLSGMIFGEALAIPLATLAFTLGGSCGFLLSRYALRDLVRQRFAVQLQVINRGIEQDGTFYLVSMRMIPVIPFWLLNLLMGLSPLRASQFVIATAVGMLPITIVLSHVGAQLGAIQSFSIDDILTPNLLLSLSALAALPFITRWGLAWVKRRRQHDNPG